MEFNDSQVRDYKFENLDEDCQGDEEKSGYGGGGFSWGGGNYGKSGYMLFYERRKKKNLNIVLPYFKVKPENQQGSHVIATVVSAVKDDREATKQVQAVKDVFKVWADKEAADKKA